MPDARCRRGVQNEHMTTHCGFGVRVWDAYGFGDEPDRDCSLAMKAGDNGSAADAAERHVSGPQPAMPHGF